ncbi:MAG: pyrroline-5-carboxylate reductase, partial [Bacteroidota bacterium]
ASIARGLLNDSTFKASELFITKRNLKPIEDLQEKGANIGSNNPEAIKGAEIIILAVKPYKIIKILDELNEHIQSEQLIISLATGISIAEIKKVLKLDIPVFRAMPNTATGVNESATCIASHDKQEKAWSKVNTLFNRIGLSIEIKEELMDAATVLGACGVAFVLRFVRAMVQAGIQIGFDAKTANLVANQTVKGATELLLKNGQHPEEEIDKVTTPRGCTIAGLNEMEHQGFSSALIKGIITSFQEIKQ